MRQRCEQCLVQYDDEEQKPTCEHEWLAIKSITVEPGRGADAADLAERLTSLAKTMDAPVSLWLQGVRWTILPTVTDSQHALRDYYKARGIPQPQERMRAADYLTRDDPEQY